VGRASNGVRWSADTGKNQWDRRERKGRLDRAKKGERKKANFLLVLYRFQGDRGGESIKDLERTSKGKKGNHDSLLRLDRPSGV